MMEEKIFITTDDGMKICGIWTVAQNNARKAIILAHGITVDKEEEGKFTETAQVLNKNGFDVFRFDFRGHGESDGISLDFTISGALLDLKAAFDTVRKRSYKKIGLVGASFGGSTSVLYTADNPNEATCLCLWNPVLNYDHCFINPTLPWLVNRKQQMYESMSNHGFAEIGSRNFRIGTNLWEEMKLTYPFNELKSIEVPTMIIHGDADTYVPYEDSQLYLDNLRGYKVFVPIKNGNHGLNNNPTEKKLADDSTLKFFMEYL